MLFFLNLPILSLESPKFCSWPSPVSRIHKGSRKIYQIQCYLSLLTTVGYPLFAKIPLYQHLTLIVIWIRSVNGKNNGKWLLILTPISKQMKSSSLVKLKVLILPIFSNGFFVIQVKEAKYLGLVFEFKLKFEKNN